MTSNSVRASHCLLCCLFVKVHFETWSSSGRGSVGGGEGSQLLSPSHIQMWQVKDAEKGGVSEKTGGTNGKAPQTVFKYTQVGLTEKQ